MDRDQKTQNYAVCWRAIAGATLAVVLTCLLRGTPVFAAEVGESDPAAVAPSTTASHSPQDVMDMSLEDLLNVQITTASRLEEKQSDAPGMVSVVTKDELVRFGGTTLKDVLERVPGLIGSSVYMTDRSMIAVRGDQISNSGEHVLLLINGRPVREVQEGGIKSEVIETFPVDIIERIEVVKGPGSVLYGSTAFAGVINVITERPERTGASITGLVGEAGAHKTAGHVTVRSDDFGFIAAGQNLVKADWPVDYAAASPSGPLVNRIDNPNDGTGGFLETTYKDFSFMASHNQWETSYLIPDYMPFFRAFGLSHWEKTFLNLGYDKKVTDRWRTTANIGYSRSQFDTSAWPSTQRDSSETLLEWTNFVTLSGKSTLTVGGLADWVEGTESDPLSGTLWSKGNRFDYGFYAQVDYQLLKNLKAIGGAQANKIENIHWDIVPRAGLIWYPAARINVKALYGQAFRAPSINETHINHPAMMGTLGLEPEKVGTLDLVVGYQGEQGEVQVDYFHSNLTDIIYQDRSGPTPTYANRRDAITIQGAELEGKYYLNKAILLTGSILYQTSEDGSGRTDLSPVASFGAKAGVSYASTNGFTVGVFDIYQGPLNDQYKSSLNPSPGEYNKLSLHSTLNLKKFFQWKEGPDASLILQADNLLDKQIWLPNWGLLPGQSIPYDRGRAVYVGLNLRF
jgi:outer membrane receptor for ferrienterochelin and colicins